MRDSEILGLSTELMCQLAFTKLNIVLSKPITSDSRYDYIADINNKLYKIQCKTSILNEDKNSITFRCYSSGRGSNGNYSHCYSDEEVDLFYTCYNNISYLIPIEEIGSSTKTLRFNAECNNPNISWAKDYEIKTFLKTKFNYEFDNKYLFKDRKKTAEKELNHCIDCGVKISYSAVRCNVCSHKQQQKVLRPNREELKNMIRKIPFTAIGQKYGVTDNAIKKWCKAMNLPSKKSEINEISDEDWSKL